MGKAVELVRRKREALVGELFKLARPAADARAQIAVGTRRAYAALLGALAAHGLAGLQVNTLERLSPRNSSARWRRCAARWRSASAKSGSGSST